MNPFDKLIYSIKTTTIHSQSDWQQIESAEKAHQDVIARARAMMKAASIQYRQAVQNSKPYEVQNLTLNWSPKKLLAINKAFPALCRELEDVDIWNKLRPHERKFIADAYAMVIPNPPRLGWVYELKG